jgi:hypothetical protein
MQLCYGEVRLKGLGCLKWPQDFKSATSSQDVEKLQVFVFKKNYLILLEFDRVYF